MTQAPGLRKRKQLSATACGRPAARRGLGRWRRRGRSRQGLTPSYEQSPQPYRHRNRFFTSKKTLPAQSDGGVMTAIGRLGNRSIQQRPVGTGAPSSTQIPISSVRLESKWCRNHWLNPRLTHQVMRRTRNPRPRGSGVTANRLGRPALMNVTNLAPPDQGLCGAFQVQANRVRKGSTRLPVMVQF
jgi:hypothetical protein